MFVEHERGTGLRCWGYCELCARTGTNFPYSQNYLYPEFFSLPKSTSPFLRSFRSLLAQWKYCWNGIWQQHGLILHAKLVVKATFKATWLKVGTATAQAARSVQTIWLWSASHIRRPYIRLNFGSDGNLWTLTPSLVVLLHPAATHLDGICQNQLKKNPKERNKLLRTVSFCAVFAWPHAHDV